MYFIWKDAYCVNIREIDKQHKRMFEIGRQIADLVLSKETPGRNDEILDILRKLRDYTIYHFGYEESIMEQFGYMEFDLHKTEHVFLAKKLQRLQNKESELNQKIATAELIAFVSDWICDHILKSDMRYKEFFNRIF